MDFHFFGSQAYPELCRRICRYRSEIADLLGRRYLSQVTYTLLRSVFGGTSEGQEC